MGKTNDPAKIIKKLEEKIEKLEAQIEESPKKGINLNNDENSVQIGLSFELHPSVYGWFSDTKAVKAGDRASYITKALNTGLLALWQGRVSHALKQFKGRNAIRT